MNSKQPRRWQPWLLAAGLALSLVVAGVFVVRAVQHIPHPQVDESIHGWMTVPYIARSHRVPATALYAALGLPARPPDRRPIMYIARAQGRPLAQVIADLQKAIAQARQSIGTPMPTPTLGNLTPGAPAAAGTPAQSTP